MSRPENGLKDTALTQSANFFFMTPLELPHSQGVKCPIFSYFLKNSYFFLFFTKIPIFSYFSVIFFDFHIIFLKS